MTTVHPAGAADADFDPADVLVNPVWHALATTHQRFARVHGSAVAYDPDVTVFAAVEAATSQAWSDLEHLAGPGNMVMLARADLVEAPAGWVRLGGGLGYQMVLEQLPAKPVIDDVMQPLTPEHVPQMMELVELTKPGPFRPRTIELGNYWGVFAGDRLVAMAGERVQTPGYTEVSAVCTHPSARGRGLAAALSHHVASGIVQRGQTPVLHVHDLNVNARRVYERLGFVARRQLEFVAWRTPGGES
jgi:ribosomal protein S18 acetylase RimI-like enzyme